MISEMVLTAFLGGALMSLLLGPLGCFVLWRRMAYFGDATAHAALLGVAVALLVGIAPSIGMFAVALLVALALVLAMRDLRFPVDTLLGFLAHGMLALGLLLVALSGEAMVDLDAFLFGDILTLTRADIPVIAALVACGVGLLALHWRGLVLLTLEPSLATVAGYSVTRLNLVLVVVLALTVALGIKLVGVLLLTALLIMPAVAARVFARSPLQMAMLATVFGIAAIALGLHFALRLDVPTGPMIVVTAMGYVLAALVVRFLLPRSKGEAI
jgi:zinc transport system permease protein